MWDVARGLQAETHAVACTSPKQTYGIVWNCIALHCTAFYCTALPCIAFYCPVLWSIALHTLNHSLLLPQL